MPKPIEIVDSIEVALAKADLPEANAAMGNVNATQFMRHPSRAVKFLHFAGALDQSDGLYKGKYLFTRGDEDSPRSDLNQLPGLHTERE